MPGFLLVAAYSSERRTGISAVAVTPRREFMKYPG
jgi:hypothetical protein